MSPMALESLTLCCRNSKISHYTYSKCLDMFHLNFVFCFLIKHKGDLFFILYCYFYKLFMMQMYFFENQKKNPPKIITCIGNE